MCAVNSQLNYQISSRISQVYISHLVYCQSTPYNVYEQCNVIVTGLDRILSLPFIISLDKSEPTTHKFGVRKAYFRMVSNLLLNCVCPDRRPVNQSEVELLIIEYEKQISEIINLVRTNEYGCELGLTFDIYIFFVLLHTYMRILIKKIGSVSNL